MISRTYAIAEIRRSLKGSGKREQKAQTIAGAIREVGNFRWVGIYDVGSTHVSALAWNGPGAPAHPVFPKSSGLTGAAIESGETVVVGDVSKDSRYLTTLESTRSEIIIPIKEDAHGNVVGTIDVESELLNAFTGEVRSFLEECARAAASLWRRQHAR
jgi:putative methionine-R-sulfoxide reductase with GAF domain